MVGTQVGVRHRSNLSVAQRSRCLHRVKALRATPARCPRPAARRRHRANHEAHHCPTQGRPRRCLGMTPEGLPMAKLIYEKRGQIAYITLNRPEVHNAIDTETDELLFEAWTDFRDDPDVRIAILTGAGDKTFCAGADLKSHVDPWLSGGPELGRSLLEKGFAGRITRGLHRTPKPIIAALNGWVIGGGIELALACDIRVAADDIQFGFYHMRRGMHFGDGGIVRLVNTCGVGIAMELELMGEPINAQRAQECHLVNRVVPGQELMSTVEDIAAKILRNPRVAVESAKETILEVVGRPLDDQLRLECMYSYSTMSNPEIVERKEAFLGRRDTPRPGLPGPRP